ncbi:GFA family protein [Nocardia asiatica]|uniref:GFA family protein n=1 Tax=Nocardia asiatica TaxID=209252 RepID=UPI0024544937|nr:GFA family protein [Nocardia asiatica]
MHEGGCLCGQIRFRAEGEANWPHLCSCPHCQKLAGGPVTAWVDFPLAMFAWTGDGGEPSWFHTYPTTKRGFCSTCGSLVAALDEDGDAMGITMMALDDHSGLTPVHQSCKDNAVKWLPVIETIDTDV